MLLRYAGRAVNTECAEACQALPHSVFTARPAYFESIEVGGGQTTVLPHRNRYQFEVRKARYQH